MNKKIIGILICILFVGSNMISQVAGKDCNKMFRDDTSWRSPTIFGLIIDEWNDENNVAHSDNAYANDYDTGEEDELDVSAFGFNLIFTDIIDGIQVSVEARSNQEPPDYKTLYVKLSWDGGSSWTSTQQQDFSGTETTKIYGSPTNTWGRTWAGDEFSDDNFRVMIIGSSDPGVLFVDHIQVRVFYTLNTPPNIYIIYPEEGDRISGEITISGDANDPDGNIEYVEVKIDDEHWEDASGTINWIYIWNTTQYQNEGHTIFARSYDGKDYSNVDKVNVTVDNGGNQPPDKPTIDGLITGKPGVSYEYTFTTTDPDDDQIYYYVEWGDTSVQDWFGPFKSGETATASHSWSQGHYEIRVKAKDTKGAESEWSDPFPITMPRNKAINNPFFNWLQSHPYLFPLLQKLLQNLGL